MIITKGRRHASLNFKKSASLIISEAHSSCLTLQLAFLINFAAKHSWEARDVTKDGKLSDDNDGLKDPLDLEWEGSDSPGDDETDSEHQAGDEPSEQRLSDKWNTSQHIQHSPEPWSPALPP